MSKKGLPSYLNTKLKIHSSAGPYFGTSLYMLLCDNENKMFGKFIAEVNANSGKVKELFSKLCCFKGCLNRNISRKILL